MSEQPPETIEEVDVFADIRQEWLGESKYTADTIAALGSALILLAGKRSTLEEKMIARYFHALIADYSVLLNSLHSTLAKEEALPEGAVLERLRTLNLSVFSTTQELLKALRYNLNYLEQYFEFGFCTRLTQEYRFNEELEDILEQMGIAKGN